MVERFEYETDDGQDGFIEISNSLREEAVKRAFDNDVGLKEAMIEAVTDRMEEAELDG